MDSLKPFRDVQQDVLHSSNGDKEISKCTDRVDNLPPHLGSPQCLGPAWAPPGPSFWSFP